MEPASYSSSRFVSLALVLLTAGEGGLASPFILVPAVAVADCSVSYPQVLATYSDCHSFDQCVDALRPPLRRSCGFLMFNPLSLTCDWPENVVRLRPECSKTFSVFPGAARRKRPKAFFRPKAERLEPELPSSSTTTTTTEATSGQDDGTEASASDSREDAYFPDGKDARKIDQDNQTQHVQAGTHTVTNTTSTTEAPVEIVATTEFSTTSTTSLPWTSFTRSTTARSITDLQTTTTSATTTSVSTTTSTTTTTTKSSSTTTTTTTTTTSTSTSLSTASSPSTSTEASTAYSTTVGATISVSEPVEPAVNTPTSAEETKTTTVAAAAAAATTTTTTTSSTTTTTTTSTTTTTTTITATTTATITATTAPEDDATAVPLLETILEKQPSRTTEDEIGLQRQRLRGGELALNDDSFTLGDLLFGFQPIEAPENDTKPTTADHGLVQDVSLLMDYDEDEDEDVTSALTDDDGQRQERLYFSGQSRSAVLSTTTTALPPEYSFVYDPFEALPNVTAEKAHRHSGARPRRLSPTQLRPAQEATSFRQHTPKQQQPQPEAKERLEDGIVHETAEKKQDTEMALMARCIAAFNACEADAEAEAAACEEAFQECSGAALLVPELHSKGTRP